MIYKNVVQVTVLDANTIPLGILISGKWCLMYAWSIRFGKKTYQWLVCSTKTWDKFWTSKCMYTENLVLKKLHWRHRYVHDCSLPFGDRTFSSRSFSPRSFSPRSFLPRSFSPRSLPPGLLPPDFLPPLGLLPPGLLHPHDFEEIMFLFVDVFYW